MILAFRTDDYQGADMPDLDPTKPRFGYPESERDEDGDVITIFVN